MFAEPGVAKRREGLKEGGGGDVIREKETNNVTAQRDVMVKVSKV